MDYKKLDVVGYVVDVVYFKNNGLQIIDLKSGDGGRSDLLP